MYRLVNAVIVTCRFSAAATSRLAQMALPFFAPYGDKQSPALCVIYGTAQ